MPAEVSIILPTYNRAASLPAAINSVLTQSFEDFELIVVDDGSPEDIETLVRGFSDPRIRYIRRPKNGGAAAARNTGIANARGNYIAFQDSDDLWLPGKLEMQMRLFAALPAKVGIVTGPKILYAPAGRAIHGVTKRDAPQVTMAPPGKPIGIDEDQVARLLVDNRLSVQCALFKCDHLPDGDWFDTSARANEDYELAVRLAQRTTLYEGTEAVVLGFVSGDSISTNPRREITGIIRILKANRAILGRYRPQRSALLGQVGRWLYKSGKRRWGRRFILASLADDPRGSVFSLGSTAWRKSRLLLLRTRRRQGAVS